MISFPTNAVIPCAIPPSLTHTAAKQKVFWRSASSCASLFVVISGATTVDVLVLRRAAASFDSQRTSFFLMLTVTLYLFKMLWLVLARPFILSEESSYSCLSSTCSAWVTRVVASLYAYLPTSFLWRMIVDISASTLALASVRMGNSAPPFTVLKFEEDYRTKAIILDDCRHNNLSS